MNVFSLDSKAWRTVLYREWKALRLHNARYVTAFDLDGDEIRVAQMEFVDKVWKLLHTETLLLNETEEPDSSKALREKIRHWKVHQGRVVTFVPRHLITLKRVSFPSSHPAHLQKMAPFEASRFLPYPPEDIVAGVEIIQVHENKSCEAWLAALPRQKLIQFLDIFDRLGLEPDQVGISTHCLAQAAGVKEEETSALCFLGCSRLDLIVVSNSQVLFSRGMDRRLYGDTPETTTQEIERTLALATEGMAQDTLIPLYFAAVRDESFNLTHKALPPIEPAALRLSAQVSLNGSISDPLLYAPAIGACVNIGQGIDLLPVHISQRRLYRETVRRGVFVAAQIILFVLLMLGVMDSYLRGAEGYLREKRAELQKISREAKGLQETQRQLESLVQFLNPEAEPLDVYAELFSVVPDGVTLVHFQLSKGEAVLKGQSPDYAGVWGLTEALSKSPVFQDLNIQYATSRRVQGTILVDFGVRMRIAARKGGPRDANSSP